MTDDDTWYYGSIHTREPSTVRVVKRSPNFLTLDNGTRVKIDGDTLVYRPSKKAWLTWRWGELKRSIARKRFEIQQIERDLVEAEQLLESESCSK